MPQSLFVGRRRHALQEAARTLDALGINQSQPVDVFAAINRLGLWLTFLPLQNLLGSFIPEGQGGVMITTRRPPAIQRYTAAHEIGHAVLDHGLALDDEAAILRASGAERERLAQLFAAYFLMPPELVHSAAARYGVRPGRPVEAVQAYQVARDMRVSYEAALRQLAELAVITKPRRDELLLVPPLEAKRALAHGARPVSGNADVWSLDEQSNGAHVDVLLYDEVVLALPESPATGYKWLDDAGMSQRQKRQPSLPPPPFGSMEAPLAEPRPALTGDRPSGNWMSEPVAAEQLPPLESLAVVADRYWPGWAALSPRETRSYRRRLSSRPHGSANLTGDQEAGAALENVTVPRVGATGRRWLSLRAREVGTWRYTLQYAPPYDPTSDVAMTFVVEATVRSLPADEQRLALLRVDLDNDPIDPLTGPPVVA